MKSLLLSLLAVPAFAQDVRVLSFNIRYNNANDGADAWPNRKEAVAKLIQETADLTGLQEAKPDQRAWLIEKLPEFGFIGIGREPGDRDESVPIAYRKDRFEVLSSGTFWLSDTPEKPGSKAWNTSLPRICTWARLKDLKAGKTLWFYNVHLDHQSAEARKGGLSLVGDRMAARAEKSEPAILLGDFNSGPTDPPIATFTTRKDATWISTYTALNVPAEGTFHGFTNQIGKGAIDFIFIEKDRWQVRSGSVLKTTYRGVDGKDRFVSDHFPIAAVLGWPGEAK